MRTVILILVISLFSCNKIIEIDVPKEDPLIVINGLMSPLHKIRINLSESSYILDDSINYINGANVKLYRNGVLKETLQNANNGFYIGNTQIEESGIYKIEIEKEGYNSVFSIDTMPEKVTMSEIMLSSDVIYNSNGQAISNFIIEFNDPLETENYYQLHVFEKTVRRTGFGLDTIFNASHIYFDDIILREEIGDVFSNNNQFTHSRHRNIIFTDNLFNGETTSLKIDFQITYNQKEPYPMYVKLYSISKTYYNLLKKQNAYSDNNEFWDSNEATFLNGNIVNGLGIFTTYQVDADTLNIDFDVF